MSKQSKAELQRRWRQEIECINREQEREAKDRAAWRSKHPAWKKLYADPAYQKHVKNFNKRLKEIGGRFSVWSADKRCLRIRKLILGMMTHYGAPLSDPNRPAGTGYDKAVELPTAWQSSAGGISHRKTVDERAFAEFESNHELSHEDIAKKIGCHVKTLANAERCPKYQEARKRHGIPRAKGFKDSEGNIQSM
jgi:hypothetical protein